jgi:hypothetical protein
MPLLVTITLAALGGLGGWLLMRRWRPDRRVAAIFAGCIVIASSTYTLFTQDPESLRFRLHVALILFSAVAILIHATRPRGA